MKIWLKTLMNRLKFRKDFVVCVRTEDAWRWPSYLDKKTEGKCSLCNNSIYFERKNRFFQKICYQCCHRN